MITVAQLGKRYGDLVAVNDVSLTAKAGEVFGLLGPNGAGKSTTIGCISGLLTPTSGRITVLGHDVVTDSRAARQELGIVPQDLALYEDLSARENLAYWGAAYGLTGDGLKSRVLEVLERIGLGDRAREPVKRFSGGMKRRLNFGCGVVHKPKVLLLDEPTVGVDPQSRVRLLELVREEVAAGTCVVYTTHYMEEAQDLCNRIAIIDHGKLLSMGTLDELRKLIGEKDVLRLTGRFDTQATRRALEQIGGIDVVSADERTLRLAVEGATRRLAAIFTAIETAGGELQETSLSQPSLESLFIKLTGRELRE
jgi:ABC-2 type transport system ATP-binding protein